MFVVKGSKVVVIDLGGVVYEATIGMSMLMVVVRSMSLLYVHGVKSSLYEQSMSMSPSKSGDIVWCE